MKCLNPSFCSFPPTDVRFWFKEQDGSIKEVNAHTQILASASEVFNREFYGSLRSKGDIEIKDARQEVFQTMVEFIYNKKPSYKEIDLSFLASLYYLAEKYDVLDLRNKIIVSIPDHEVTKENVLDVANLAEENIHHQRLSEALYEAAASFVKKAEMLELFTDENDDHAMVIFKVIKRAKKLKLKSENLPAAMRSVICASCKQAPCRDGQRISTQNFTRGAKVYHPGTVGVRILIGKDDRGSFSATWENGTGFCNSFSINSSYKYKCK